MPTTPIPMEDHLGDWDKNEDDKVNNARIVVYIGLKDLGE
jgi:hypothetical protein